MDGYVGRKTALAVAAKIETGTIRSSDGLTWIAATSAAMTVFCRSSFFLVMARLDRAIHVMPVPERVNASRDSLQRLA
jgi:hypothetical protein